MGHIVNLAQQTFICTLMGNANNPAEPQEANTGNDDEIDFSGLEIPSTEGPIIGPLLVRIRTLIAHVSYISIALTIS